jgi:hypothetical protein
VYSRSAAFDAAVQKSHTIATKVEVYDGSTLLDDISLEVFDGNIVVDDVAIHRRCTLTLTDPTGSLSPANAFDVLAPLGNEVKLFRGIKFPDGTKELLAVGTFGIADTRVNDSGAGLRIDVVGYDRARRVQRARFATEYIILKGINYATAIEDMLRSRYPQIVTNFPTTDAETPQLVFEAGKDPWKVAQDMAASIGMDLYFDPTGTCIMVPVTLVGDSDWTYFEGSQAMILYANKRFNDERIYNHVVFTGETSGVTAPVRAEAVDDDPKSPTYYLGKFGDVTKFQASSFVTTVEQAQAAADRNLAKNKGLVESMEIQTIVHPAHEVGDIIHVYRAKTKINAQYMLSKITIPMVHDRPLAASVRQRQV